MGKNQSFLEIGRNLMIASFPGAEERGGGRIGSFSKKRFSE